MHFTLEVIGFTIESCIAAQAAGAHRIELCDNPGDGGTTPSYGLIRQARKRTSIELYPIIRPRGGDFLYSDEEFEIMMDDIRVCKSMGCDGVVIGMLLADGSVDKARCSKLVSLAYPMGVTFHRAFDRTNDAAQALETIIDIGCERILTSGQAPDALSGAATIAKLVEQAGDRIIIMPGSGVRAGNIIELAKQTGAVEFHTSARMMTGSNMQYSNATMKEQLQSVALDAGEVKEIIGLLEQGW